MAAACEKKRVCLTGFGPFSYHIINDSWRCVKKIKDDGFENELGIELDIREIPVTYDSSQKIVDEIWDLAPYLVIHVGVHNEDNFKLEKLARKKGYCKQDVNGTVIENETSPIDGKELMCTGIQIEKIIDKVQIKGIDIRPSQDAGLFLCEYTYYMSLCKDSSRALFVHIPPEKGEIPLETKVEVLKEIIKAVYTSWVECKI